MWNRFPLSRPDWPLSTRLTLWYGGTMLVLLSMFAVFCYATFHAGLHRDFDRHLAIKRSELMADPGPPNATGLPNLTRALTSGTYQADGIYGTYVRLLSPAGTVLTRSPNFQAHPPLPVRLPARAERGEAAASPRSATRISRNWDGKPARTHYVPLRQGGGQLRGWLELTGFEWSLHQGLHRLGWILALGVALSLFLAMGGGYLLARRALRPVAKFTEAAGEIGAANLEKRLPVPAGPRDELTRLAETFNDMVERLEDSFKRERRFTANAAHELLTPLTTMRNEVEVALRRDRSSEGYQDTLRRVLQDAKTMTGAVRALLELARVDRRAGGEAESTEPVNLSALARKCLRRFRARAEKHGVTLRGKDTPEPVWVRTDAERLREALGNLIDNALKYTPDGGQVTVTVEVQNETGRIVVADTGVGFAPETAEHLFGRFFRADAPAVQAEAGSGLGLAVARNVARGAGGDVTAHSDGPGRGSTFTLLLPLLEENGHSSLPSRI